MHELQANTALTVPCQHNEAFPGSCTRETLVHMVRTGPTGGMAYVTCEKHGTFRRSEGRTLTVTKKNNARVVR